jgi:hypothetical protein
MDVSRREFLGGVVSLAASVLSELHASQLQAAGQSSSDDTVELSLF